MDIGQAIVSLQKRIAELEVGLRAAKIDDIDLSSDYYGTDLSFKYQRDAIDAVLGEQE